MLEIVYRGIISSTFCCEDYFEGGMVTSFTREGNLRRGDSHSVPVGFFLNSGGGLFLGGGDVSIVQSGIIRTDMFDISRVYYAGDPLYCNEEAKITNDLRFLGNPTVGMVWGPPDRGLITVNIIFTNIDAFSHKMDYKDASDIVNKKEKNLKKFNRYDLLKQEKKGN